MNKKEEGRVAFQDGVVIPGYQPTNADMVEYVAREMLRNKENQGLADMLLAVVCNLRKPRGGKNDKRLKKEVL